MIEQLPAASPTAPGGSSAPQARPEHAVTFHEVLSALNPLQYLPVVGTIYRAVTGDIIPEPIRRLGSLIVSGLLGGPLGIAINLATTAAEKITGIDLDQTGQALLLGEPVGQALADQRSPEAPPNAAATEIPMQATRVPLAQANGRARPEPEAPLPWSAAQLAAYGVQSGDAGTLHLPGVQGADVLNALELTRLHSAHAAYARVATIAA